MRRWLLVLMAGALVLGWHPMLEAQDKGKLAVVDMEKFQEKSRNFQKIAEELRQKYENLKRKLDEEREGLVNLEDELRKQSMMLSLDAREDKQKQLEKKSRYFKFLQNEYTQEMKDAELEARRRVTKEVAKAVKDIGKKKGYLVILDKGTLGLLYAEETIDITDEVIRAYDRTSP